MKRLVLALFTLTLLAVGCTTMTPSQVRAHNDGTDRQSPILDHDR